MKARKYVAGAVATVILPMVILAIAKRPAAQAPSAGPAGRHQIPQPSGWVPFQAEVIVTTPGVATVYGRFYRSADGSTRIETGTESQRDLVISINNVPQGMGYVKGKKGWRSHPRPVPDEGHKPRIVVQEMIGLSKLDQRIWVDKDAQLIHVDAAHPTFNSAFDGYRYETPKGDIQILVPALNFFPILRQTVASGRREGYWNVRLDISPPLTLFLPPAGVAVTPMPPEEPMHAHMK